MKKFILSILMFVSLQSTAGVRSVGNGGGLGELQFIYYFNMVDQIIAICEKTPSCQQTPEQKISWQQLKNDSVRLKNNINISFQPAVDQSWSWTNTTLLVSQQWLYQSQLDQLRPDAEIMIFALAIQLSHTQNLDFQETYGQTAKSLSGLSFYKQSSTSSSGEFQFHWISLSNQSLKLFILEDSVNSYSLNDLIQSKFKNINLHSLELYNVIVINSDSQINVYGSISGLNGEILFNQRPFKITANISTRHHILKESIQLFLFLE